MNIKDIRKLSEYYSQGYMVEGKVRDIIVKHYPISSDPESCHQFPWTYAEYQEYIRSDKWKSFACSIIKERGSRCEKCSSHSRLQVHHLHYTSLGEEDPKDVMVLCYFCHSVVHGQKRRAQRQQSKPKDCWQAVLKRME